MLFSKLTLAVERQMFLSQCIRRGKRVFGRGGSGSIVLETKRILIDIVTIFIIILLSMNW